MPKVYLRPVDKFKAVIAYNFDMVAGRKTMTEIGKIIGRSTQTACNRRDSPLDLTLREVFLICQHEHIDPAEFVGGELRLRGSGTIFIKEEA